MDNHKKLTIYNTTIAEGIGVSSIWWRGYDEEIIVVKVLHLSY